MMKRTLSIASLCLFPLITFADGILQSETMPYNWTGFYAGPNLGAVKQTMNVTDINATSFNATIDEISNPDFTGGLQIGYRYQLPSAFLSGVFGLEFSADFSNASFSEEYGSSSALYQINANNQLRNVLLLQLIGGSAADKTLLFLAAGFSATTLSGSMTAVEGVPFFTSFNADKTAFGTALGAGVEYAATQNISLRFKFDVITPNAYTVADSLGSNFQIANHVSQGTVGLNYRFA